MPPVRVDGLAAHKGGVVVVEDEKVNCMDARPQGSMA